MERVRATIDELEADLRRQGVFLLVDVGGRKLWFYGYKKNQGILTEMMESLKPRRDEMIRFLLARARAKG